MRRRSRDAARDGGPGRETADVRGPAARAARPRVCRSTARSRPSPPGRVVVSDGTSGPEDGDRRRARAPTQRTLRGVRQSHALRHHTSFRTRTRTGSPMLAPAHHQRDLAATSGVGHGARLPATASRVSDQRPVSADRREQTRRGRSLFHSVRARWERLALTKARRVSAQAPHRAETRQDAEIHVWSPGCGTRQGASQTSAGSEGQEAPPRPASCRCSGSSMTARSRRPPASQSRCRGGARP